jgi:hypothetical protein
MDKNKKYEEFLISTDKIKEAKTNDEVENALLEFEMFSYGLAWERMYNDHWIKEPEDMHKVLDFFIRVKDTKKCEYISWLLNTYYPSYLSGKFNEYLENEEYEKCASLNELVKVKNMPII